MKSRPALIVLALAAVGVVAFTLWRAGVFRGTPPSVVPEASTLPAQASHPAGYVGSQACARCHSAESAAWSGSQHAVAMQAAGERTVLGNFDDATFEHFGVTSRFFRRDGKFMVRTDGPDGRLADFEVSHTFGVYPLQQYLVDIGGGRIQALTIAWDSRPESAGGQRWFHLYPSERIGHDDELHWTKRQQNWNYMCADCHTTDLQKNYDAATDTFRTRWSELSVGCEACHGPGSAHVKWADAVASGASPGGGNGLSVHFDERRTASWRIDPVTGNAMRSRARGDDAELDVCAQCHSRRGQFSNGYRPGEKLQDHYLPALLVNGLYWPDGQQRDEVYNWGSFLSSRMYSKGVTCGDCHEPHGAKLRATGNGVCAQCHLASKYDAPSHHFHAAGTAGAACASCHMKTETYMIVDARHDHSFRIPRPDLSERLGVPNACNQCHQDRTAAWASAEIRKRYRNPKPGFQDFAEAFASADRGEPSASIALTQLVANLDESAIARASALDRLAQFGGENALLSAEAALEDRSALVRHAAIGVFDTVPPDQRRQIAPLLSDPIRSVRMRAARTLAPLPERALGPTESEAFARAADEYVAGERFNADRPENRVNLGGFFAERGRFMEADAEFRAALALDPAFVPAWVNLADLMRMRDREADAESILREGLAKAPSDATLHHALGLSLVRQKRNEEALRELKRATELAPDNSRFAYVYGVASQELKPKAAGKR
ncbi:MAG: tetratricopeptide repeat protein [Gammaproteobacteria bacterium]|nr:tetratricopeptide repeat protein [Gammaproteobacteria bacterium]